ncbi:hypothetical protein G9A89_014001 [Geosiphon pyriformis]|nr:hypothetical protein G9A89_014001 [Geosiphon pyriformis]
MSLKKAKELAVSKKIPVNSNIRQINKCTNQKIVVKEIPTLVEFELLDVASLVAFK